MRAVSRSSSTPILLALLLGVALVSPPAKADISEMAVALAGPLAEQFGVPASAVTALLEGGVSLESVTQLLLVSQSSGKSFGDVTQLFEQSENDVGKTAEQLEVRESAYGEDEVASALDQAQASLQADGTQKATDEAKKALGSALEGFGR